MNERVLFEAAAYLVIDKPAGALVIPGRGEGTAPVVLQALEQERRERLFVVHRLDRDTSGLLVLARTASAHRALSMAFEAGRIEKHYRALCVGRVAGSLDIDVPLRAARRGRMRPAQSLAEDGAKPSRTRVRALENFGEAFSDVEAQPLTGRTHQIRVHLLSVGHPLAVDHQYGRPEALTEAQLGGSGESVVLARTPLHASRLWLPELGEGIDARQFEAPLPADMARALELLRSR